MFIRSKPRQQNIKVFAIVLATIVMCGLLATTAAAQSAPYYPPDQMERLVSRVALYPDPLLAQVLAAATFPDEIPDAEVWADQHHDQNGSELAASIDADQLPWDPSVQALLPFPNVLHMMASDMRWTGDLGNAFLGQQQDVMYAVQRMRQRARDYGYLRSGPQIVVAGGPYITIMPARPDYVVVPYYDPVVVYARPRVGFFIGGAIGFRFGVALGAPFRPWGWGYNRIAWDRRVVFINNAPWQRTWVNRHEYHHPYSVRYYPEHHNFREHEVSMHGREHDASFRAHERNEIRHEEHREVKQERHEDHRAVQVQRHEDHRAVVAERHEDYRAVQAERHEDHRAVVAERHENKGHEEHAQKDRGDHGHGDKDDHHR